MQPEAEQGTSDFHRQLIQRRDEIVPQILDVQRRLRKLKKELRGVKILLEVSSADDGGTVASIRATLVSVIRRPMTVEEIAAVCVKMGIHVGGERPRSNLCSMLGSLAREGRLQRVGRGVYAPVKGRVAQDVQAEGEREEGGHDGQEEGEDGGSPTT